LIPVYFQAGSARNQVFFRLKAQKGWRSL